MNKRAKEKIRSIRKNEEEERWIKLDFKQMFSKQYN